MKYSVVTFGCRVNQADSLKIEEALRSRGGLETPAAHADLVVINTCSVTASADQGARQVVRRVARENPQARIVVTGCYATRRPQELAPLPGVVRVVPNDDKLSAIDRLAADGMLTTADRFAGGDGPCGAAEPGTAGRTAFTLRVQTGCDEGCTYCIIPSTRGRGRSLPPAEVVREAARVAASGFKEVVLAGVHLGSYGRDLTPPVSLADLLRALSDLQADVLFRISSLEPMDCTAEVLDLVTARPDRFAPHFHLPLQHASDAMLRAMRRPYTSRAYRDLLDAIVTRLPHAAIGSDVIAGFPGESDSDFRAGVGFLLAAPLSHLHVFPYSDRPGTVASALPGRVAGAIIRERAATLRGVGAELARRFRDHHVGTVRSGLTLEDGTLVVTDNYLKVRIPAGSARNVRVRVRVTGEGTAQLAGTDA